MKRCTKCGEEKPLDAFGPRKSSRDGLHTECRDCRRAYKREWMRAKRHANPEWAREVDRKWREENPEAARAKDRRFKTKNRDLIRKRNRERRRANPDRARASYAKWRAKNRDQELLRLANRRALQRNASDETKAFIRELLSMPCSYCGTTEGITIDHVIPLSRGGKHETNNLAPACLPCNCSKNDRLLSEWDGRLDAA